MADAYVRGIGNPKPPAQPFDVDLLNAIRRHESQTPKRFAFISADNPTDRITFGQLRCYSDSLAVFLQSKGFAKGDVACVLSSNCWESTVVFMSVARLGGILSGISMAFTEFEVRRQLLDCEPKVVFCHEQKLPLIQKLRSETSFIQLVVVVNFTSWKLPAYVFNLHAIFRTKQSQIHVFLPQIDIEKDVVALPYSSGTSSGLPKGVQLTHKNLSSFVNAYTTCHAHKFLYPHLASNFDPRLEYKLHFLPQNHVFGFMMPLIGLMHGFTNVIMSRYQPQLLLQCIQEYKIKQLHVVPPIVLFLAKSPMVASYDLTSLKTIYCGSAPLGLQLTNEVRDRLKLKSVTQGYGMTELVLGVFRPTYSDPPQSAGKLIGDMEAKIVDIEKGRILKRNEIGEILVRGSMVMAGYWRNPKATAETFTGNWMHTGDLGYLNEDGCLFLVDRLKELIKVAPAELEDVLLSHPQIADAAVIGVSNLKTGELPYAFVVKKDEQLTTKQVHLWIELLYTNN
ncbi:AMP-binding enzyme [Aphelenchoides besseyi]|nr:AMP-binding enzyme [Aphelenchoides besseyi]